PDVRLLDQFSLTLHRDLPVGWLLFVDGERHPAVPLHVAGPDAFLARDDPEDALHWIPGEPDRRTVGPPLLVQHGEPAEHAAAQECIEFVLTQFTDLAAPLLACFRC